MKKVLCMVLALSICACLFAETKELKVNLSIADDTSVAWTIEPISSSSTSLDAMEKFTGFTLTAPGENADYSSSQSQVAFASFRTNRAEGFTLTISAEPMTLKDESGTVKDDYGSIPFSLVVAPYGNEADAEKTIVTAGKEGATFSVDALTSADTDDGWIRYGSVSISDVKALRTDVDNVSVLPQSTPTTFTGSIIFTLTIE